jgi:hypothetical protein
MRLAAGTHNNSCSEKLGDYRHTTPSILPFQCRYLHGFVVAVQTIVVECIESHINLRATISISGFSLISLLSSVLSYLLESPVPS